MIEPAVRRWAALNGLVLAAAVTLWWLGSARIAIERGADAAHSAADALYTLWLVRGLALALLVPRAGASRGWEAGAATALGLVVPAWPVLVLAWSASTVPWAQLALAEALLLATGLALAPIGPGLRRALRSADLAEAAATMAGVALAAALWRARGVWALLAA